VPHRSPLCQPAPLTPPRRTWLVTDQAGFVRALRFVFEGPPWIVEAAWADRPFDSLERLYEALRAVMDAAPVAQQVALLRAHPDLVGRAALAGTLSAESREEQASAGLDRLSPAEVVTFKRLNAAYQERFGFPFIICVREHRKESILAGFESRLTNSREHEISTALGEVARIGRLRLLALFEQGAP